MPFLCNGTYNSTVLLIDYELWKCGFVDEYVDKDVGLSNLNDLFVFYVKEPSSVCKFKGIVPINYGNPVIDTPHVNNEAYVNVFNF